MSYTILHERKKQRLKEIDNSSQHSVEQSILRHLNNGTPRLPQLHSNHQRLPARIIPEDPDEIFEVSSENRNFTESKDKKADAMPSYSGYAAYKFYNSSKKPNKLKQSSKVEYLVIEETYKDTIFERYISSINIDQEVIYLGCSFMGIYLRGLRENLKKLKETKPGLENPGRRTNELPHIVSKIRSGTQYTSNNLLSLSKAQFSKNSFFLKSNAEEESASNRSQPDLSNKKNLSSNSHKQNLSLPPNIKGREFFEQSIVSTANESHNNNSYIAASRDQAGVEASGEPNIYGINFPEFTIKSFKENLLTEPNLEGRFKFLRITARSLNHAEMDVGFVEIDLNEGQKEIDVCKLFIMKVFRKMGTYDDIHLKLFEKLFHTYPNVDKIFMKILAHNDGYKVSLGKIGFKLIKKIKLQELDIDLLVLKKRLQINNY